MNMKIIKDMKPTKEFKEWVLKYGFHKWRDFRDIYFEGQEGYYRAYFREKGYYKITVKEILYRPVRFRGHADQGFLGPKALVNKTIQKQNTIETTIYKTYPEAFEALVNKLFEV